MTDADWIREMIADMGLSQVEAARRLEVDERTMRYWCSGQLSVPKAIKLALEALSQEPRNSGG